MSGSGPLSEPRRRSPLPVGRAFWVIRQAILTIRSRPRRALFIARVRLHAFWQRAEVQLDIANDVWFGSGVRVRVAHRTRNTIRMGPSCSIGDRTSIYMNGGQLIFGEWVDLRRDGLLSVSGTLLMEGVNMLQPGVSIHCDDAITLAYQASIGEYVTFVDSVHYYTEPEKLMIDNLKRGTIHIGRNTWIGAKATIGRNVTVGDFSVVAGNSLVLTDVPSGHLASGVPAEVLRRVRLPWLDGDVEAQQNQTS